jgi:glycosyltransferase involved in cell wall biosynthesis
MAALLLQRLDAVRTGKDRMNAARPRSLSVVMPYYNEELNVRESIGAALAYLRPRFDDFEVVAVDDHSTDRTLTLARAMRAEEPRIKIVALAENTRFAGALKRGFAAAEKEYVFYTDGDCPIDFEDLDRAFEKLAECDVVVGYRITRDAEGWIRKLYTAGYRWTLRLLLGLDYRDVNFSFKLFPKRALDTIRIDSDGSFIDAEILYRLGRAGYRIGEIPVRYHSRVRGTSTLASPQIIFRIVGELWRFRRANRIAPPAAKEPMRERVPPVDRQRG